MKIEMLESRIAPAAITVSYHDIDDDVVKITASKGLLDMSKLTVVAGQLELLNLTDPSFEGATITFAVTKSAHGDGLANVGRINATGVDLGAVTVKGDLGVIDAGNTTDPVPALKSLTVRSMGRYGNVTQGGTGDLESDLVGSVGTIKIAGDLKEAAITISGAGSTLTALTIGGAMIGGDANFSGSVTSTGDIGTVKIGGDMYGGKGTQAAKIGTLGALKSVTVGGNIFGLGMDSAAITSVGAMGTVKIAGSVLGGPGSGSGSVHSTTNLTSLTIGGTLYGGGGQGSGEIRADGAAGTIKIGGDVVGGGGNFSGRVRAGTLTSLTIGGFALGDVGQDSGGLFADGNVGTVTIAKDLRGNFGSGSGAIQVGGTLGAVNLGGTLIGGYNDLAGAIKVTGAVGTIKITHDVAGGLGAQAGAQSGVILGLAGVKSITIGGSMVGGNNHDTGEISFQGDIGSVTIKQALVGGNLVGTSSLDRSGVIESTQGRIGSVSAGEILAGLNDSTGTLTNSAAILAKNDIGSITVKGAVSGNHIGSAVSHVTIAARGQKTVAAGATTDVAIGSIKVGGRLEYTNILGGYVAGVATNGNAQIGKVTVGGDWIASSIVAGIQDGGSAGFGDAGDTVINNASDAIISRIASVTIKGTILGTSLSGDHFGFTAQRIGSVKALNFTAPLTTPKPDPTPDAPIEVALTTGDVTIREI